MNRIKPSPIVTWLTLFSLLVSFGGSMMFAPGAQAQSTQKARRVEKAKFPSLSLYATDLTEMARLGKLDSIDSQEAAVNRAIQILSRDSNNNPVLTGESIADSKAVAEALAQRVVNGDVPAGLRGKRVFSLNLDSLFAGLKTADAFSSRLQLLLDEVAQAKGEVILFAPELQQFVGQRAAQSSSNALSQAMERGDLQLIGATSSAAFAQYIQSDDSLKNLFLQVSLDPTTIADADNRSEAGKNADDYVGDKVSPDLRDEMKNSSPNDKVKLILQVADIRNTRLTSVLGRYGVQLDASLSQLGTVTVEVPVRALSELAAINELRYISKDRDMATLGHIENTTGAATARANPNLLTNLLGIVTGALDGSGIGIAILDSGMDPEHLALAGRIIVNKDFTGENRTDDPYGHGTHVASAAAGYYNPNYGGIAPNAKLINLRVLNRYGSGTVSGILSALDWVMANKTSKNIRVVNMSLGGAAIDSYKNDPICRAVRRLSDAGVVVVVSAGNNGKDSNGQKIYGAIHTPGNEPSAITIGATNTFGTDVRSDDVVATYSSRGPTRSYWTDDQGVKHYDNLIKPDLVAPGNKLIYAESKDNYLVTQTPALEANVTTSGDEKKQYMYLSGTSMAAPVTAGAAALMLQVNPKLTPNMVKAILMYTSQPVNGYNQFEQGAGQLNIDGAVRLAKLFRQDITNSTALGAPLLTTSSAPVRTTTIAGQTFTWGQGMILGYSFVTGLDLIMKNQGVYRSGIIMSDGVTITGNVASRNGILLTDGVQVSECVRTSNGVLLSDGVSFMSTGVLLSDGRTSANGIMLTDGVLLSDGILLSDGVLLSDGIMLSDSVVQAMSSMLNGDNTASMAVIPY